MGNTKSDLNAFPVENPASNIGLIHVGWFPRKSEGKNITPVAVLRMWAELAHTCEVSVYGAFGEWGGGHWIALPYMLLEIQSTSICTRWVLY